MSKQHERCPHCGAKMNRYRHVLNRGLVSSLIKLAQAGGQAKMSSLDLSYNERNNFQKLQYFGLIRKNEDMAHVWIMTDKALNFLRAGLKIESVVWTFRSKLIDAPPGEKVQMKSVDGFDSLPANWRDSLDYSDDAQGRQSKLW